MILKVSGLHKKFGTTEAVSGLNFTIEKGRCIALLGPNGAGKTTTLQMLAGLSTPTSGSIKFINQSSEDRRKYIGFLPQYPNFYDWMTPMELLKFVGELSGINKRSLTKEITKMLAVVRLEEVANKRIGNFSGGMKQRLGLAQALLHKPRLLLLDEPVSSLDPVGRREVMNLLHELKQETTIFFSTHVLHDAEEISDDIFIMKDGKIKVAGTLQQLKQNKNAAILKINTIEKTSSWLPDLQSITNVFQETPYVIHLTVEKENLEQVKQEILKQILAKSITLQRFEVAESSLEDLFLKVVGQG